MCHTHFFIYSYLIAKEVSSERPLGFVSFRFDLDDDIEVIYW